jgi:hypothetical protein
MKEPPMLQTYDHFRKKDFYDKNSLTNLSNSNSQMNTKLRMVDFKQVAIAPSNKGGFRRSQT